MNHLAAAGQTAASLSAGGAGTLYTSTALLLALGIYLRKHVTGKLTASTPAAAIAAGRPGLGAGAMPRGGAGASVMHSLKRRGLVQRFAPLSKGLDWVHIGLAWLTLLVFAVAGLAASGTVVATVVLFVSHLINSVTTWAVHLIPVHGQWAALAGVSLLGVYVFWRGLHLLGSVLKGTAHHGDSDWLVFFGPMLFPLVPGVFGVFMSHVYQQIGAHVGTLISGWV